VKQLKGFDQYVKEADREPVELPMPDGKPIVVHYPTLDQIKALAATGDADFDAHVRILFGEKDADRLMTALGGAPADVLQRIVTDIREEFGVGAGNWLASSG
jgi:hypothetical protein